MGNVLNKIVSNNALFVGVIIALCIILIVLVLLIIRTLRENKKINIYEEELEDDDIKKIKNVKKEDIIDSPDIEDKQDEKQDLVLEEEEDLEEILESRSEEEITNRYDEEKEKEIEEIKEENAGSEIEELISRMEQDSKMRPEDVVANFEKEQEAQSIISYRELVNAVKNRQEEIYEDELESKPLTTVSECMKARELESVESEDEDSIEELATLPEIEDAEKLEETKFRKTDFISPVFGRVEPQEEQSATKTTNNKQKKVVEDKTIDLSDVDLFDAKFESKPKNNSDAAAMTALDEIYNHMAADLLKSNEELGETASLEELTKNEEFLQSLKDFRKNL